MEEVRKVTHFVGIFFLRPLMAHSFYCVSSMAGGGWR